MQNLFMRQMTQAYIIDPILPNIKMPYLSAIYFIIMKASSLLVLLLLKLSVFSIYLHAFV